VNIAKVITGGQTGADQGALRAARAAGIPTGGYVPKGWLTEDGPAPWLADFGLVELTFTDYARRTRAVASDATGCLWFGNPHSPGGICTLKACAEFAIASFVVMHTSRPRDVAEWIGDYLFDKDNPELPVVLMVAGNRESKSPGIGLQVERFMAGVFPLSEGI
jgi:hypothetical protein